jgi:hypothetical protein
MKSVLRHIAPHALAVALDALPTGRFNPRIKPAWRLVLGAVFVELIAVAKHSADRSNLRLD